MLDPRRGGRCTARLPLSTCPPAGSIHYPLDLSVGPIRWIYPLDLSVGRQLPTGAASCHWHILSQQPAQLALRWSRLSTPRGGPRRRVPGSPEPALPCLLRPCSLKRLLCLLALILVNSGKSHGDRQGQELAHTPTPSHPLCPPACPAGGHSGLVGAGGPGEPKGALPPGRFRKVFAIRQLHLSRTLPPALLKCVGSLRSVRPSGRARLAWRCCWTHSGTDAVLPGYRCPPAHPPDLSVGSIRWICPLDLSVGWQLPTGAASCLWHILSQQPAQLALRWSRLSTPRGGPSAASPAPPSRPYPAGRLRPCSF